MFNDTCKKTSERFAASFTQNHERRNEKEKLTSDRLNRETVHKFVIRWTDWFYKPVRNLGFALSLVQASFRRIWRRGRCLESPIVQIPLIASRGRLLWRLTHNVSVRLRPAY